MTEFMLSKSQLATTRTHSLLIRASEGGTDYPSNQSVGSYYESFLQELSALTPESEGPTAISASAAFVVGIPQHQMLVSLMAHVAELQTQVRELTEALDSKPNVYSMVIHEIGTVDLRVVTPFSVVVEETDDETIARWPEIRVYGVGDTLGQALVQLKAEIAALHTDLSKRDPNSLGKLARKTLQTLNLHIIPVNG